MILSKTMNLNFHVDTEVKWFEFDWAFIRQLPKILRYNNVSIICKLHHCPSLIKPDRKFVVLMTTSTFGKRKSGHFHVSLF